MKNKFILYFIIIAVVTTACNKQLDNIRPLTQVDAEGQLGTLSGIQEVTTGNYLQLKFLSDLVQDLNESHGNNVTLQTWGPVSQSSDAFFYRNAEGMSDGNSNAFYRGSYALIVSINITLNGIDKFEKNNPAALTAAEKDALRYVKGENLFLRGLAYFNLARIYGKPYYQDAANSLCVPVKTSGDPMDFPARSHVKEVYDFVIYDLTTAGQLMKTPTLTRSNAYASTFACWALLSRVYLYMSGTATAPDAVYSAKAAACADSVINSTNYQLLKDSNYLRLFAADADGALGRAKGNNKEFIFALNNEVNPPLTGQLYNKDQHLTGNASFKPAAGVIAQLAPGDKRSAFLQKNEVTGILETTKFLVLNTRGMSMAPYIYLRLAEMYLNRAEALTKLGDPAHAREDLLLIHTRAGLPATDITQLPAGALMAAILRERTLELAFEGHASFDYFRVGWPVTRTAADNNGQLLTISPDDPRVVFAIPNN
jgi:hypothetical protein